MKKDHMILPIPENLPVIGGVYQHYKGDKYEVVGSALHSNDDVWVVVYKPLYDNPAAELFVRPLADWGEKINWNGEDYTRFTLVK